MKDKIMILAIHYNEKDLNKLQPILDEMKKITAKINTNIGEIWQPYNGDMKRVYGLIDDLILLNLTPEQRETPSKLIQKILLKRCEGVQTFLRSVNPTTDEDLAYSIITHISVCPNCQDFVGTNFNIGGNRDVQLYIQRKLKGEKFEKLNIEDKWNV